MSFMFEKLDVYQKAVDFTDHVSALTETFPRGYYFLADQLNRAALSIATNLAEGNGRFTKADRKNFFMIARGLQTVQTGPVPVKPSNSSSGGHVPDFHLPSPVKGGFEGLPKDMDAGKFRRRPYASPSLSAKDERGTVGSREGQMASLHCRRPGKRGATCYPVSTCRMSGGRDCFIAGQAPRHPSAAGLRNFLTESLAAERL